MDPHLHWARQAISIHEFMDFSQDHFGLTWGQGPGSAQFQEVPSVLESMWMVLPPPPLHRAAHGISTWMPDPSWGFFLSPSLLPWLSSFLPSFFLFSFFSMEQVNKMFTGHNVRSRLWSMWLGLATWCILVTYGCNLKFIILSCIHRVRKGQGYPEA